MQPTSTNGNPNSARAALDVARQLVEKLEADLQKQQEEIKQLRAERDDFRHVFKTTGSLSSSPGQLSDGPVRSPHPT